MLSMPVNLRQLRGARADSRRDTSAIASGHLNPKLLHTLQLAGEPVDALLCLLDQKLGTAASTARPHCLTRSASSKCKRASANDSTNSYCAEFGTKTSQVSKLQPLKSARWGLHSTVGPARPIL
jgi:hypothetical protein